MKKLLLLFLANSLTVLPLWACPVCEKRQPRGLAGITHGAGPAGAFDYAMLYGSLLVVALAFGFFVRFALQPDSARNLGRGRQLASF